MPRCSHRSPFACNPWPFFSLFLLSLSLCGCGSNAADPRFQAIDKAVKTKGSEAIHVLKTSASDHIPSVRRAAARALGILGDPAGIEILAKLTNDKNEEVCSEALRALGMIDDPRVIPYLAQYCNRPAAKKALHGIGFEKVAAHILSGSATPRMSHLDLMDIFGPATSREREEFRKKSRPSVRLVYSGEPGLKHYFTGEIRTTLGESLTLCEKAEDPQYLLEVNAVPVAATYDMGRLASELSKYRTLYAGASVSARFSLILNGSKFQIYSASDREEPPSRYEFSRMNLLADPDLPFKPGQAPVYKAVKKGLFAAIRSLRSELLSVPEALASVEKNNDSDATRDFLVNSTDPSIVPTMIRLLQSNAKNWEDVAAALAMISPPSAAEYHRGRLFSGDEPDRIFHITKIGALADRQAVGDLTKILQNERESKRVRTKAAEALGRIGDRTAESALIRAMKKWMKSPSGMEYLSEDEDICQACILSLSSAGGDRAAEELVSFLEDAKDAGRWIRAAAWALANVGGEKAALLVAKLYKRNPKESSLRLHLDAFVANSKDPRIEKAIFNALGEKPRDPGVTADGKPRNVEVALIMAKSSHPADRTKAALALGIPGDTRAVDALLGLLKDEDSVVRRNAAESLGKTGSRRAVEPLSEAFRRGTNSAAIGMAEIDLEKALGPLLSMLQRGGYDGMDAARAIDGVLSRANAKRLHSALAGVESEDARRLCMAIRTFYDEN